MFVNTASESRITNPPQVDNRPTMLHECSRLRISARSGYNPCVREDHTWPRTEARRRKSRSPRKRSNRDSRCTLGRAPSADSRVRNHQPSIRGAVMRTDWVAKRQNDVIRTQMHYARKGIVTEEMRSEERRVGKEGR